MSTVVVNAARPEDVASARRFSVDTGMFEQEESGEGEQQLLGVIRGQDPGTALTAKEGPVVVGAGYFAPEPFSDRCWNLYFLVVDKDHHGTGTGIGSRILNEVEQRLRETHRLRGDLMAARASYDEAAVRGRVPSPALPCCS